MFKLAVLSTIAAVVVAKPGNIGLAGHGGVIPAVHTAVVGSVPVSAGTVPLGVTTNTVGVVNSGYSQSSRVDYATPIVGAVAAPVAVGGVGVGIGAVGGVGAGIGAVGGAGLGIGGFGVGGAGLAAGGLGYGVHGR